MPVQTNSKVKNEALLLSHLGHPNIIRVFDANGVDLPDGNYGYFTMEYIAGGTLEKYWQSFGSRFVPPEKAVDLIRQACCGMAIAHQMDPPIIHRDIKPQNILIGYDQDGLRVRLSDFGLARQVNPLTLYASARGTLCFKAPEIFIDSGRDSCAGDVWALGCTLYLLLTDQFPFPRAGQNNLNPYQAFLEPWKNPSEINWRVDPVLERILQKALALQPEDRYPDASQLLAALEGWSQDGPTVHTGQRATESQKDALGAHSPLDDAQIHQIIQEAFALSHEYHQLARAADLLEEALVKSPRFREKYEYQLQLWRRGITG